MSQSPVSQSSSVSLSVLNTDTAFPTASVMLKTPITDAPTQESIIESKHYTNFYVRILYMIHKFCFIIAEILNFFRNAPQEAIIGIAVGGALIVILLAILILLCCCCVCSKLRKTKKKRKYDVHNAGYVLKIWLSLSHTHTHTHMYTHTLRLSISNPSASNSMFSNGTSPAHYQHHLDSSHEGLDQYDLYPTEAEPSQSQYNRYQQNTFRETAIDIGGPSQPHHSQMSVSTDIFREGPLPQLSPLSYSSQFVSGVGAGVVHQGLSVDNIDSRNHSASLGNIGGSPILRNRFPCSSPSLRVPTRMALSLQNEESKSAHGSRVSIQGSRTSFQGSRPSIVGSGSRSQIHGSSLSREFSSSLLSGHREEDDMFSLPLSGQTISPQHQNSLGSMELPTRDSPLGTFPIGTFPIATSHSIGHGKQDFASLTCIPNQLAMEDDLNDTPQRQELNSLESQAVRRRSLQGKDFGALTTLDVTEAEGDIEIRPPKVTETIQEEESIDKPRSKSMTEKNSNIKSSGTKKPRSRAMSRLEKLTSIDYLRASLRLKKKRVSFENNKSTTSSTSSKKEKDLVVANKGALDNHHDSPSSLTNGDSLASPDSTLAGAYGSPHHHSTPSHASDVFSPTDYHDDQFSDVWHPRNYTDHPYGFQQLSQPTFYGSHMMPQPPYQQHGYPQLSQQYYPPQMRQNYSLPPHTHFVPIASPFRRGSSDYSHNGGGHYRGSGTPDFSDITTPEHEHYSNKERTMPDHLLEGEHPESFHYYPGYPPPIHSPNGYDPSGRRVVSPDALTETSTASALTETSTASARYQAQSPNLFGEHGIIPPVHSHGGGSRRDSLMSDGYPQGLPNDRFNGVPTYPVDLLYSPRGGAAGGGEMENYGGEYPYEKRRHSDQYEQERQQFGHQHRNPGGFDYDRNVTPEQYLTSPKHYAVRSNRQSGERRTSAFSDSSVTSDKMDNNPTTSVTSKSKVSWSTEVIEYPRTPSDMDESDFDLNQL